MVTAPVIKKHVIKQLGHYRLLEKIGEGGMGLVFLAEDTHVERKCVVKVIKTKDKEIISRFKREAQAAGKLNHPNIVTAYMFGEENGIHYYAMEYCDGISLDIILDANEKALPWKIAVEVIKQIASGLEYAHTNGVVHRDIKPANIIICKPSGTSVGNNPLFPNGFTAKVLDLGLSKIIGGTTSSYLTQTGKVMGTPHYMSPEQALAEKDLDERTDIYSLGATFYEMVTGQPPFDGETPFAVIAKHMREKPRNPKELNQRLPDNVAHVILKMLSKNKCERYTTCKSLLSVLETIDNGKVNIANPYATTVSPSANAQPAPFKNHIDTEKIINKRVQEYIQRRLWIIGLSVSCFLAIFIGFSLSSLASVKKDSQRKIQQLQETLDETIKEKISAEGRAAWAEERDEKRREPLSPRPLADGHSR